MTLRHIYNNILNFKQSKNNNIIEIKLQQNYDYDQQPTPPQTFIKSKVQHKISNDLTMIKQRTKNNHLKKFQPVKLNVIQNYKSINKYQNNKNITEKKVHYDNEESQLFVPQRKKSININININKNINNNLNRTKERFHNSSTSTAKQTIKRANSVISQRKTQNLTYQKNKQTQLINNHHTIDIVRLRRLQKGQKQQQTVLKNRLNYISIDSQRQKQKIQFIKRKYQKVLSVRNQSLKQKQMFHKIKMQSFYQDTKEKYAKIQTVKKQKSQRKLSISRLKQLKTITALEVKNQNKFDTKQIKNNKLTQLNFKKQLVRKTRSSLQTSREKINQINRSRISSVRSIQNKRLINNYVNFQKRQKQTQKLYEKLQKQIKLINQRKLKAASELKQYQTILIPQKNKIRINSSRISKKGSKSFYLTNY